MKKEIMALLAEKDGYFRINNFAKLHRWTSNFTNKNLDKLAIEFDAINGVRFGIADTEIESREYAGIISECAAKMEQFWADVSERTIKELKAGHI